MHRKSTLATHSSPSSAHSFSPIGSIHQPHLSSLLSEEATREVSEGRLSPHQIGHWKGIIGPENLVSWVMGRYGRSPMASYRPEASAVCPRLNIAQRMYVMDENMLAL